jgi:hypothetical protein
MNTNPAFSNKELKLNLPFGCVVAGPSTSGKSTFIRKLISHSAEMISPPPRSIAYFYGEYSDMVRELQQHSTSPEVQVLSGLPTDEQLKRLEKPALVILDDLLYTLDQPKYLADLFSKKAHHMNMGVVFVAQDVFERKIRVARQNSQYLVLTRAPSSALSIRNLGIQLFPGQGQLKFFLDAYRQATAEKYSYLFVDLHPASDPSLRLRTNIFPDDPDPLSIFTPKNAST